MTTANRDKLRKIAKQCRLVLAIRLEGNLARDLEFTGAKETASAVLRIIKKKEKHAT